MKVQPYLSFDGRCEEALDFYKKALGAEVTVLMRFKDNPESANMTKPENQNKVMHSEMRIGEALVMASDGYCTGTTKFSGISMALTVADDAQAQKRFAALGDGGEVKQPLIKTFFASSFGMVTDRFGVDWMIVTEG